MATITLPSSPAVTGVTPLVQDFGGLLVPFLGGPSQRINRLGTRFGLKVRMPVMKAEIARPWISRLVRGMQSGVVMRFPQDIAIGSPGAPQVNGVGQLGSALLIDGFMPGYGLKDEQFFSLVHGGRRYLHMVAGDVTANGAGQAAVPIFPMLRVSPADNAVCEFAEPKIEGWLQGAFDWELLRMPSVQLPEFVILEAE